MTTYADFYKDFQGVFKNHPQPCSGHMIRPVPARVIEFLIKKLRKIILFTFQFTNSRLVTCFLNWLHVIDLFPHFPHWSWIWNGSCSHQKCFLILVHVINLFSHLLHPKAILLLSLKFSLTIPFLHDVLIV